MLSHNVKQLFKKCIEINQAEVQTNITGLTRYSTIIER